MNAPPEGARSAFVRDAPHCREVVLAQMRTRHARFGAFSWCPSMTFDHSRVESPHAHPRVTGGMAERSKALVLKTSEVQASVGSNPTPSASNSSDELRRRSQGLRRSAPEPRPFPTTRNYDAKPGVPGSDFVPSTTSRQCGASRTNADRAPSGGAFKSFAQAQKEAAGA